MTVVQDQLTRSTQVSSVILRILLMIADRQRHVEAGTYSRGDAAATYVNSTLNSMKGSLPEQIEALRRAIRHMIETHDFRRVLIFVRTSPSPKPTDKEGTNTSIERQLEYLGWLIGHGISVHFAKAVGVSASKDDSIEYLKERLLELGEKTLVLTTRVDRSTRSLRGFERLQEIIAAGGHGIASMLWDFETEPLNVCLALRLPETDRTNKAVTDWETGLMAQKRAPMVRLSRPIHQPILWMFGSDKRYVQQTRLGQHH